MSYQSKYQKFRFTDWQVAGNEVIFTYKYDDELSFSEKLVWPEGTKLDSSEVFKKTADAYHLLAGVSYFKAYLAKEFSVENQDLTQSQVEFLNKTYKNGLGEYLYVNELDPELIPKFKPTTNSSQPGSVEGDLPLLLIGGGKDSLASAEILSGSNKSFETFRVNSTPWIDKQLESIGKPSHKIKRFIDKELLDHNKHGALNGHVPITAIISMAAVMQAAVSRNSAVIVSNEASANIPNTDYLGMEINHQYSKSIEAEAGLASYIKQNIALDLEYFSLIRPWTELRVVEYFAHSVMDKYSGVWSSSNHNFKIDNKNPKVEWDGYSPKSLSVFGMLAAFVERDKLLEELGFNGFNLEAENIWSELLGITGIKPFECVADIDEMRKALMLAQSSGNWPELTDFDIPDVLIDDYKDLRAERIPDEYKNLLPSF